MLIEPTDGARAFADFLDRHKLTLRATAAALGVSDVTVLYWRDGRKRPGHDARLMIERWTGGTVPVLWWLTAAERERVDAIVPFKVAA